jgi:hypothetical protein
MITLESVLELPPATACQSLGVGQDSVILSMDSGYLYTGNQTTHAFLNALDGRRTLGQVADVLAGQFDVRLERLQADLLALAGRLLDERLIVVVKN